MKTPLIHRYRVGSHHRQRGVTMILVALAMVAIVAMAALSIDVVSLYLAKQEAQRSADDAAVAAAKVLVLTGITGDPANSKGNWATICGGPASPASLAAQAVAQQDPVSGIAVTSVTVTYSAGTPGSGGAMTSSTDCSTLNNTAFGVNPLVTVQLTRPGLPNFFSRIWGSPGQQVSATAMAEAFNPSNSGNVSNQLSSTITPVNPWCVKPWVVPNQDPLNPQPHTNPVNGKQIFCNDGTPPGSCQPIIDPAKGSIQNPGMSLNGTGATGIIGESFQLEADCIHGQAVCNVRTGTNPPQANLAGSGVFRPNPPNLLYLPGQVGTNGSTPAAIPACTSGDLYEEAIEGCDQPINYTCGVPPSSNGLNAVDLTRDPDYITSAGVACLIHQTDTTNLTGSSGQDSFNTFAAPTSYPFHIFAGSQNPMVLGGSLPAASSITNTTSIVALPIYDSTGNPVIPSDAVTSLTFIGFLQVFINGVDAYGNVNVTVLNVAGCGNGTNNTSTTPVGGNSPIPVRLITPPTS